MTSEKRNREANPVEEALRKQWKATYTYARTQAGRHASHGKGAGSRGQAAGIGSKRERVPPGKGGSSTPTERVARLNKRIATKFDRNATALRSN